MANPFLPTRRAVLRGLGGITVGLPFLEALGCRKDGALDLSGLSQRADAAGPPKRIVFFMTENGTDPRVHFPIGSETSFTFPEITAPLEPLKSNLIFTKGIDNTVASLKGEDGQDPNTHYSSWACQLTGRRAAKGGTDYSASGGISLDQFLANQIGTATKFKSLEFGYSSYYHSDITISFYGANQPVPPEGRPDRFFDRVFSGVSSDPGGGPDPALVRLREDRMSVLDAVKPRFTAMQPRLSTADRHRLDEHLAKIRDLEKRISEPPPITASCVKPPAASGKEFPATDDVGLDLMAYALGCDLTRVATVMFNIGDYHFLGVPGSYHDDWLHHVLESSEATGHVRKVKRWIASRLVDFVEKLKAIPEGDGTVFDNTLVVWCDEYCHGYNHKIHEIPYVLLSGKDRFFKMGRFLDYGSGVPNNQLWLSIRDAMGATGDFGDPAIATSPLPRIA